MRPVPIQRDRDRHSTRQGGPRPPASKHGVVDNCPIQSTFSRSNAMWPHLTIWEFVPLVALSVAWLFPDWVLKLLKMAEAVRRFRRGRDDDKAEDD